MHLVFRNNTNHVSVYDLNPDAPALRNEFSSQLHRFMAHLTDAQHKTVGHTVLYVPDEGSLMTSDNAPSDKELVQRLEGRRACSFRRKLFHKHSHVRLE